MTTKRVYSDFQNPYQQLSSTEEFIRRCKTMYSNSEPQQNKHAGLDQSTIMTFISILSDIAVRCQSLETHIKDVQTQVSNLQKTVQDLCIPISTTKLASNDDTIPKSSSSGVDESEEPFPEEEHEESENEDIDDIAAAVTITNVKHARSKPSSADTETLRERLQTLQWKTFDLQRQNELLRRMLEIQCTVNENAAKVAADKQKEENAAEDANQSVQQADSTSNNNSASDADMAMMTPSSPKPDQQDYVPTGAPSSTASPAPSPDPRAESPEHEEYVPLSAEEMLAQSFADPKVPWSSNDGTENSEVNEIAEGQAPNIKYAYVYAPFKTAMWKSGGMPTWKQTTSPTTITATTQKGVIGSTSVLSALARADQMATYRMQSLDDIYRWERKVQESPNTLAAK